MTETEYANSLGKMSVEQWTKEYGYDLLFCEVKPQNRPWGWNMTIAEKKRIVRAETKKEKAERKKMYSPRGKDMF